MAHGIGQQSLRPVNLKMTKWGAYIFEIPHCLLFCNKRYGYV